MRRSYVAYGLQLHSCFRLPGMTERGASGLPALSLGLLTPEELEHSWSGSYEPPAWRGMLGDGSPLTLERGIAGDLLFTYADRARFLLDGSRRRLDAAPAVRSCGDLDWQQVLLGKVLCQVGIARGYEALHAAAVESPAGVVAFAGPSGAGKSTLALEFMRRGWPLFADDVLTLEGGRRGPGAGATVLGDGRSGLRAHPGTPHMNVAPGMSDAQADALGRTVAELAGERWLAAHQLSQRPRPVRMLCVIRRAPGLPLALTPLPANPLLLARHMLGLPGGADRQRRRFELYCELTASAAVVRLTADLEQQPARLADLIERAAGDPGPGAGRARRASSGRPRLASRTPPLRPAGSLA